MSMGTSFAEVSESRQRSLAAARAIGSEELEQKFNDSLKCLERQSSVAFAASLVSSDRTRSIRSQLTSVFRSVSLILCTRQPVRLESRRFRVNDNLRLDSREVLSAQSSLPRPSSPLSCSRAMLLVIPIDPPDVTLSSTTLSRLADITAEELLCLEAIYAASFLRLSGGGFRLKAAPLELTVRCSPSYPFIPPLVELCLAATSISRFQLFELEARIRAVIDFDELVSPEDCEAVLGGELCELVVDFAADLRGDDVALMHDRACECSDCIPNYARASFRLVSMPNH